jgi:hypothetical protein
MPDAQTANPITEMGGEAISLHQAIGSLLNPTEEQKPAAEAPPPRPSRPQAPETAAAAEPAEEAPAEEAVSEEATDDDAGEDAPRHEPPAHWKKAAKELFATLSPEVQAQLVAQERERDQHINRKMEEAAELRKGAETERSTIETERQRLKSALDTLIPDLEVALQGKWAGVNWAELAQKDQATYVAWQHQFREDVGKLQLARQHRAQIAQQETAAAQKARDEAGKREYEALVIKRPELKDPAKSKAFFDSITDYAREIGFPPDRFAQAVSHLELLTIEKAMKYDRAQAAKAAAIARPVPQVQQPGASRSKGDRQAEARAAQLKRLEQTGDIEDARGLLRR